MPCIQNQTTVSSSKPVRIDHGSSQMQLARADRDMVQVTLRIGCLKIRGGRHDLVMEVEGGSDHLKSPPHGHRVSRIAFERGYGNPIGVIPKYLLDEIDFNSIHVRITWSMGTNTVNLLRATPCICHCRTHGAAHAVSLA